MGNGIHTSSLYDLKNWARKFAMPPSTADCSVAVTIGDSAMTTGFQLLL